MKKLPLEYVLAQSLKDKAHANSLDIFRTVCRVYQSERATIGRKVNFRLTYFGSCLGLDPQVITHEMQNAITRHESLARASAHPLACKRRDKRFRFVGFDSKIHES